ncbi:MAG: hypothetical protein JW891_04390 [Candidatus Lokiarchaeota archaeon]|nr:hypothetical protein [Candidatus Lokiarchaeota archaeon]
MIKKRDFYHQNIKYSFNWNLHHHKEKLKGLSETRAEFKRLGTFFKQIYQTSLVPNKIFDEKTNPRISQFKIRGLKNGFLSSFGRQLIREGKIKKYDSSFKLSKYAQNVYETYKKYHFHKVPGHEPILKHILIKDKDSVAIEVPIWNNIDDKYITGHIDLIQINSNEDIVKVIDYKPEGKFMISLPQVSTYGILLQKMLKISKIKCVSFNRDETWEYDPQLLLTDVKDYLTSHGIKYRIWEQFV